MTTPNETAAKIMAAIEAAQRAPESVRDAVVKGLTTSIELLSDSSSWMLRIDHSRCVGKSCQNRLPGAKALSMQRGRGIDCKGKGRIPRDWPDYGLLGALRYLVLPTLPKVSELDDDQVDFVYGLRVALCVTESLPAALDALVDCLRSLEGAE